MRHDISLHVANEVVAAEGLAAKSLCRYCDALASVLHGVERRNLLFRNGNFYLHLRNVENRADGL